MSTSNNRIDRRYAALARESRTGLIPYITAGHPTQESTVAVMHALVGAGADLLELGVPFSDVMADGPVIQRACKSALDGGMTIDRVFSMVEAFREKDAETPVILMGYMNPVERRGVEEFARQAAAAGVDALLLVDCPAEEAQETRASLAAEGLHQIFLAAPTTTEARMKRLASVAGGFIYYVSLKGVTGSAQLDADSLAPALKAIRQYASLPVAVGFGIATADQAVAVARHADAVVIGSALVSKLDKTTSVEEAVQVATDYLADIRAALDTERNAAAATGADA